MPRKLNYEKLQKIIETRGGKCLGSITRGKTKVLWECAEGHGWEAAPANIIGGTWCPVCVGNIKLTLDEMQKRAGERGGHCLSTSYKNNRTKLLWECSKGHRWKTTPTTIISGQWCPVCGRKKAAEKRKLTIEEMREIAGNRGGRCISTIYKSAKSILLWECEKGHQWKANPNSIKRGSWCPVCGHARRAQNEKLDIKEFHEIAKMRGGRCLSEEYINNHTKLLWQCKEGHRWNATPSHIKSKQWCPKCAIKINAERQKLDLGEMQQIAEERGGCCLSTTYKSARSKLLWQCAEGHQWKAVPSSIKNGTWCPECSLGFGERVCRIFFEQLFKKKFPKAYPKWLVNDRGNQMELDGYCADLRLAFEHHGQQHYNISTPFVKDTDKLSKTKASDELKRELCKKRGIHLIEIPEIGTLLKIDELKPFIEECCIENTIPLPEEYDRIDVQLNQAYFTHFLKDLYKIALHRDGKCLSKMYKGNDEPLEWQCAKGHQWGATPHSIKRGTWCPVCAGTTKLSIEEMQQIAEGRGGRCLSTNYENAWTKLLWECSEGHKWESAPAMIKGGRWCPKCGIKARGETQRHTIEYIQQIAKDRGGCCLSDTYKNVQTKLLWEC